MASTISQPQTQPQSPPSPPLLNLPTHHRASLAPYLPNPALRSQNVSAAQRPQLPHLTLTYATSLDAHIALAPGIQTALSGPETKAMTHYLRSQHDAILIGANTAIVDDPSLNCRHVAVRDQNGDGLQENLEANQQASQPMPIILDPSGRWLPTAESKVLKLAREGKGKGVLWIVVAQADPAAMALVRASGGDVVFLGPRLRIANGNGVNWDAVLAELADRGVGSVMVEGGAKVIMDLLRKENQRFVSSVVVTVAPVWLGAGGVRVFPPRGKGEGDVEREVGRLERVRWVPMGEDVVMAGRFTGGDQ